MDGEQFFGDRDSERDEELDAALGILKQLSQIEVAAEVGISERRLRDIEHGRVKPRTLTRVAILSLADDVRAGYLSQSERTASKTAQPDLQVVQDDGGFPYVPVAIVVFFLICIFAPIFVGGRAFTVTTPPISPNEE